MACSYLLRNCGRFPHWIGQFRNVPLGPNCRSDHCRCGGSPVDYVIFRNTTFHKTYARKRLRGSILHRDDNSQKLVLWAMASGICSWQVGGHPPCSVDLCLRAWNLRQRHCCQSASMAYQAEWKRKFRILYGAVKQKLRHRRKQRFLRGKQQILRSSDFHSDALNTGPSGILQFIHHAAYSHEQMSRLTGASSGLRR